MKIVVLDGYTLNPGDLSWEQLEKLGDLTVYDRTTSGETISRIGDAEIVFTNKTPLGKEVFDACPNMKYVGVLATGYNIVDVDAAKEKGILVTNVPAYSTQSVAQLVVALLLEICHHIGAHSESVHRGDWASCADFCYWNYPLIELAGKTFGIIGYGRIGQAVAKAVQALGMQVIAFTRHPKEDADGVRFVDLDTLLAQSDVVSLHCPLFEETKGIINQNSIGKMKDGAILINTSRGPLICEQDVADALESGKIYAAAVDVVSKEPIESENPLLRAKNCLITPHFAWAPKEARTRLMDITIDNLKKYQQGNPVNVVNR